MGFPHQLSLQGTASNDERMSPLPIQRLPYHSPTFSLSFLRRTKENRIPIVHAHAMRLKHIGQGRPAQSVAVTRSFMRQSISKAKLGKKFSMIQSLMKLHGSKFASVNFERAMTQIIFHRLCKNLFDHEAQEESFGLSSFRQNG